MYIFTHIHPPTSTTHIHHPRRHEKKSLDHSARKKEAAEQLSRRHAPSSSVKPSPLASVKPSPSSLSTVFYPTKSMPSPPANGRPPSAAAADASRGQPRPDVDAVTDEVARHPYFKMESSVKNEDVESEVGGVNYHDLIGGQQNYLRPSAAKNLGGGGGGKKTTPPQRHRELSARTTAPTAPAAATSRGGVEVGDVKPNVGDLPGNPSGGQSLSLPPQTLPSHPLPPSVEDQKPDTRLLVPYAASASASTTTASTGRNAEPDSTSLTPARVVKPEPPTDDDELPYITEEPIIEPMRDPTEVKPAMIDCLIDAPRPAADAPRHTAARRKSGTPNPTGGAELASSGMVVNLWGAAASSLKEIKIRSIWSLRFGLSGLGVLKIFDDEKLRIFLQASTAFP